MISINGVLSKIDEMTTRGLMVSGKRHRRVPEVGIGITAHHMEYGFCDGLAELANGCFHGRAGMQMAA